jgi:hypothetical protein
MKDYYTEKIIKKNIKNIFKKWREENNKEYRK